MVENAKEHARIMREIRKYANEPPNFHTEHSYEIIMELLCDPEFALTDQEMNEFFERLEDLKNLSKTYQRPFSEVFL